MTKAQKNPVNKTVKINTRQAVEHVVGLLVQAGHENFASTLLEFLPSQALTDDQIAAIIDEYDLND